MRRGAIIEDGYVALRNVGAAIKGRLSVSFVSQMGTMEAGLDYGGLVKEFLEEVSFPSHNCTTSGWNYRPSLETDLRSCWDCQCDEEPSNHCRFILSKFNSKLILSLTLQPSVYGQCPCICVTILECRCFLAARLAVFLLTLVLLSRTMASVHGHAREHVVIGLNSCLLLRSHFVF